HNRHRPSFPTRRSSDLVGNRSVEICEPAPEAGADLPVRLIVDADACPVKEQIYRVATRYRLPILLVANSWMRTPDLPGLELVLRSEEHTSELQSLAYLV